MARTVNEQWEVTPSQVADTLRDRPGQWLLLDCREADEVATASIEGALHIPMGDVASRVDEIAEHEGERVVVFCHGGVRSLKVAGVLRSAGVDHAFSMAGGIDRWSLEIDPGVPRY